MAGRNGGVTGVLVGCKAGFHYGYTHSFKSTSSTTISGWIPDAPSVDKSFTTGLAGAHDPWGEM